MPSKTPLYEWHKARGAKMVDFGGWDMPLWYPSGAVAEHAAVVTGCGLFDTSHMAVVTVKGPSALDLINLCFSKHLRPGSGTGPGPAKCYYGVFLDPTGGVIDDAIVYPQSDHDLMIVVNAGMGDRIARHLQANDSGDGLTIVDLTGRVGKMDLQGPLAARVMMKLLDNPEQILEDMTYFSFKGNLETTGAGAPVRLTGGPEILLSRTGYTGEFGFEIFTSGENLVSVWEKIVEAGQDNGLIPCGLAARDSLRAGAVLPLSHQDIGPWPFINNPWTFALPFNPEGTGFTKEFIGSRALESDRAEWTLPFFRDRSPQGGRRGSIRGPGPGRPGDRSGFNLCQRYGHRTQRGRRVQPGQPGQTGRFQAPRTRLRLCQGKIPDQSRPASIPERQAP